MAGKQCRGAGIAAIGDAFGQGQGIAQAQVESLRAERVQRLRGIADQHRARRDQLRRHATDDRIGAARAAGEEAPGAPAEGVLHAREEGGIVERGHRVGVVARDFGEALETRLSQLSRLTRYRPARFVGLADADADPAQRVVRIVDAGGERELRTRLLVAADGTGKPRNLTPGEFQHSGISWLTDSTGLVTAAQRHDTWDLDFATDLYLVPLDGDLTALAALTATTGNYVAPSAGPDGSTIAFLGFDDAGTYPQNVRVGLVSTTGGQHRWISSALDRTFEATAGTTAPQWLDATTLLGSAEDRGQTHLWRVFTDGSAPQALTSGPITVKSFDSAGGTIAYCAGAVDQLSDVFVLTDGEPRRLTSFAETYRAAYAPLTWERFAVPCADGSAEIDAWLMRPAGFDPAKQYPVVLNVHGGPHTQYGETYFDEAQFQAAAGFVVLMSNPRGGSGREQAWGQAIMGPQHPVAPGSGWGGVDVDDVMAVLDTTLARYPFCDAARVGMQGGSYGGYMATMLAGRFSDRFTAICSERAVNNVLTEEVNSDIATIFRVEHGPTHIDAPQEYERLSPIQYVRDIACPLLIIHSENDLRCPINQADELFVAMRLLGKDVTFYRFPGESHELSRSGSPVHRRQRAEIILDFFAQHLHP